MVSALTVREVVFYLDGRPLAVVTEPPYRVRVNLGEENRSHRLEVIATDVEGDEARESITTLPMSVVGSYEVELQQLYVTVSEGEEAMLGLTRDDFEIRDQGRRQQIVTFAHGDIPFTAVLLIDSSASTASLTCSQTMAPLPAASPLAFTTMGAPSASTKAFASSNSSL